MKDKMCLIYFEIKIILFYYSGKKIREGLLSPTFSFFYTYLPLLSRAKKLPAPTLSKAPTKR